VDRLREVATTASGSDVLVGYQRDVTAGTDTLRVTVRQPAVKAGEEEVDIGNQVVGALKEAFPESKFSVLGADKVGPTVGRELQRVAVLAALLAMFGMLGMWRSVTSFPSRWAR
jgi:preprotein translocase subunit SecF